LSALSESVAAALASEYRHRAAELHNWVDPLPRSSSGATHFPTATLSGHLVLHLTGNLSYYVGARIAGTGYIRNRDLEFSEARKLPKTDAIQKFDET